MRLPSVVAFALLAACTQASNNDGLDAGEQLDQPDAPPACLCPIADCGALGYQPGPVGSTATCELSYDTCTPLATCSNGMLDTGELCDGANIKPDLDCTDFGRQQGALACASGCAIDTSDCHTCGDGKVEADE